MANAYRSIKYKLNPNEQQLNLILRTFGCVRKVYNETISINQGLYSAGMVVFSKLDMNNYCNRVMKNDNIYLREVDKYALTNAIFNAMSAYKNFFERRTGYPKFKSRKNTYQSYTTNIVSVERVTSTLERCNI